MQRGPALSDRLVLCYHAVSPTWPANLSITPDALDRQLGTLAARGYRGATFTELLTSREPRPLMAATFDDGYQSVLKLAKPILDRHGVPGTLYAPTDWPGRPGPMSWPGIDRWLGTPHEPELQSLTWEEIRGLASDGWEIGSHTCSHPHLEEVPDDRLDAELRQSKAVLEEQVGQECASIAYPYGSVDARVEGAARAAGYRGAGDIPRVLYRPRAMRWPRTPIYHKDDDRRFATKVSPAMRRWRGSRAGRALDRLRTERFG